SKCALFFCVAHRTRAVASDGLEPRIESGIFQLFLALGSGVIWARCFRPSFSSSEPSVPPLICPHQIVISPLLARRPWDPYAAVGSRHPNRGPTGTEIDADVFRHSSAFS